MTSAPALRIEPPTVAVVKAVGAPVDLDKLDRDRRALIRDCERLEARLGKLRRARGFGQNLAPYRSKLKTDLADKRSQARGIGVKIKAERRRRAAMMSSVEPRPRDVSTLIAGLYRLFMDAVDPKEWDATERSLMRAARDYIQTGALS